MRISDWSSDVCSSDLTWNRGTRDGLSLEIHEPGQAPMDELKVISDAWLTAKNVREKGFSLGRFSDDYLKHFRIAVIRFEGRPVAFANLLETYNHEQIGRAPCRERVGKYG